MSLSLAREGRGTEDLLQFVCLLCLCYSIGNMGDSCSRVADELK